MYEERRTLVASVKDTSSVPAKLRDMFGVGILNHADTLSLLVLLATIPLSFSFIFGHPAHDQVLFELACPCIFCTHRGRSIGNV